LKKIFEKYVVRFLEFSSEKYAYLRSVPSGGRVLDIGCGDCRRLRYRSYFRNDLICYGLDIREHISCRGLLKEFYRMDIRERALPFENDFFDLIVLSHVIEHFPKEVLADLLREVKRALKENGYLYVEIPSEKTARLVSAKALKKYGLPVTTFNFFDDKTHISPYSMLEVSRILGENNFSIAEYGEIREPVKRLLSPFLIIAGLITRDESLVTGTLWSLVNWASYVVAKKEPSF